MDQEDSCMTTILSEFSSSGSHVLEVCNYLNCKFVQYIADVL